MHPDLNARSRKTPSIANGAVAGGAASPRWFLPAALAIGGLGAALGGCASRRAAQAPSAPPLVATAPAAAAPPSVPAGPPPWCPTCKSIFDGKTLEGWGMEYPESFVVKEGAIASTGKGSHLWSPADYGDFRIFFQVRHTKVPEKDHRPTVTFLTTRPTPGEKVVRGLGGIQFQPPQGGSWDYRKKGQDGDPRKNPRFYQRPAEEPPFDDTKWHRCEVLVKGSAGEFRAACCQSEGNPTCTAIEVLHFKDPALADAKGPFSIQIHNNGLFDEYKDLWVDERPSSDELLSTK